ncbi:MAG: nickel pincer cofactor biosynthesis protein LarC [Ilumatobacteraceae bacterium]
MSRVAWFHCFNGVAGDMALGALLDAGADLVHVRSAIDALDVPGWSLEVERTQRCGIAGSRALVHTDDTAHHRHFAEIRDRLAAAGAPAHLRAIEVFAALAEVEGRIHGTPPEDVEFHEVGSLDAIVDIVGTCAALASLGVDRVVCSPITVGMGSFRAAHGVLPNPGPAVAGLLARSNAPARGIDLDVELTTPTGAALMTVLADEFGPMPEAAVTAVGYGAGTRELPGRPNLVQVVIGERAADRTPGPHAPGQPVQLLEANVDDTTGEVLGHALAVLLEAGAYDAWVTPIVMKKGRPAHTVHVLCDPVRAGALGALLVAETGTLGLRGTVLDRWPQTRSVRTVEVDGQPIAIKQTSGRTKVEFDDARAAAAQLGLPLRDVLRRAEAAARERPAHEPPAHEPPA